jgi:eukaryotic-like serine/threonine-protein kinase
MPLSPGTRLGPYEILVPIGAGGMGEVYRARDPRLGREVAIKVLPSSFSSDPDRLRRFEHEARAAGILSHANITAVYDIGQHDGAPYVVQELLEGETVRSVLAGGRLSPRRAIEYGVQVAHGLAAAHEKGIIHRDLKPENLFVTKSGTVKILDFGLAKLTQPEKGAAPLTEVRTETAGTEPGMVLGTVGYMSPEQVRGQAADARSDIFAFGAILYEMLSGRRPFLGDSTADLMSAILKEDPPDLSATNQSVSPGLDRIVRHCLEKNPEGRFQSASDLAFDLEALSAPSGAAGVRPLVAPVPRRKARLAAGAVVFLLLALPIAGYLLGRGASRGVVASHPSYRQLTFRRGTVPSARFAPDGQTIVFSAAWEGGPLEIFSSRLEFPESHPLGRPGAALLGVSSQGELALIEGGRPEPHLATRGIVSRAALSGGAPREILEDVLYADWAPDGKTLAVVHRAGALNRLEFPVGRILYETSGWIGHPRVSPRGDRVAFFDHPLHPDDRGSVAVVDLSGKKSTLSTGWGSEEGLGWSPDGAEVWFTAAVAGQARDLVAVNLAGRQRVVSRVPGGMLLQDIFRDGRALLTRDTQRLSILCQPPGETGERDLSWLEWSVANALSADGKSLLFSEQGEGGGPLYTACLRRTDGSPVVRLGEGIPTDVSPDGKWALSVVPSSPEQLLLLPTGPGEAKRLDRGAIEHYLAANFFPDGNRILICGNEAKGPPGFFVQGLPAGKPRRVGDGVAGNPMHAISPDGKRIVALDSGDRIALLPVEGGPPQPMPGFVAGDLPLRWADDGSLFIRHGRVPVDVLRVNLGTGGRTLFKRLAPTDPAGVHQLRTIALSSDGKSYAYSYERVLSELYLAEGLK